MVNGSADLAKCSNKSLVKRQISVGTHPIYWGNVRPLSRFTCRSLPTDTCCISPTSHLSQGFMWLHRLRRWASINMIKTTASQQTRYVDSMLLQCWPTVYDVGPILSQHCVNESCLLGCCVCCLHVRQDQKIFPSPHFTNSYDPAIIEGKWFDNLVIAWTPACDCKKSQRTQDVESMLVYRWSTVCDAGPTVNKHRFTVLCLLWINIITLLGNVQFALIST